MCKIYFSKLRISVEVICNLYEIRRSVAFLKFYRYEGKRASKMSKQTINPMDTHF